MSAPASNNRNQIRRFALRFILSKLSFAALLVIFLGSTYVSLAQQEVSDQTATALAALERLKGIDLDTNPAVKAAVLKILEQVRGTPAFVEIVRDFNIKGLEPELLEVALKNSTNATGAQAMRLILDHQNLDLLTESLANTNAAIVIAALGNTSDKRIVPLLTPIVVDLAREPAVRKAAVLALAHTQEGVAALLKFAQEGQFPEDLKLTAALELRKIPWDHLKAQATEWFPLPKSRSAEPLPPISELARRKGDVNKGAEVFRRESVACITCHQVNGQGVDFGPNLSEIGAKLAKEAIYEALLDPSAGIAFGYEGWEVELKNGDEVSGLLASETEDELALKTVGGIVTHYKKSEILKRSKQKLSLMPVGLQQGLSTEELVDLVEYLSSLKKAKSKDE